MKLKDFPDSPVVKTLHFQCRGRVGLIPGLGTKILHAEWHGQKKKKKKKHHDIGRNIQKKRRPQSTLNIQHSVSPIADTLLIHYLPNIANMYPEYNWGSKWQRTCLVLTERSSSPTIDAKCIFLIPLKNILKTRVHFNCSVQFPFIIKFFPLSILLTKLAQGNKLL